VRRSLALIAVGAAVAVAAVVIVVGVTSSDGGAAAGTTVSAGDALPAGHPSVAAEEQSPATPEPEASVQGAIARLEKKRSEEPADLNVLLDLGEAYFMGQRLQQAKRTYAEVMKQDPGNVAAQVGLALVWHAQGDSDRAEEALRAVLDAHPDDQAAHYSMAILHFSAGRVDEAKAEWQTAARIDPTSTTGRRSQSFVDLLEDSESTTQKAGE
jgi:cytochrome c-type biogenesis protein CcmH/NrfG